MHAPALHFAERAGRALADALMPPACAACKEPASAANLLCAPCWEALAPIGAGRCGSCGLPLPQAPDATGQCGACMKEAPPWRSARAPHSYSGTARDLVLAFKNGRPELGRLMAEAMLVEAQELATPDLLVCPVPLHWSRLWRRGYNQAAVLSARIAEAIGAEHRVDLVRRRRRTRPTQGMTAASRRANVKGAFAVSTANATRLSGRPILLIDDVLTTGATAGEISRRLRRAGATSVDILTFARVAREEPASYLPHSGVDTV
jgi:ComF family protein